MAPTCEHPAMGWVSAAGGSNSNAPTSPVLRRLPHLQVKRCSLLSSRMLKECPRTRLGTGRWAVSRIAGDMSFRQPRLPTAAIRTPIPGASCTRHSAYTCRRRRAYTARRAKPTRIAITMGSITGSRVGTTGAGSPCAAAGASSKTIAVTQVSAPFSMAILEARLGSLRTLSAATSPTTASVHRRRYCA